MAGATTTRIKEEEEGDAEDTQQQKEEAEYDASKDFAGLPHAVEAVLVEECQYCTARSWGHLECRGHA